MIDEIDKSKLSWVPYKEEAEKQATTIENEQNHCFKTFNAVSTSRIHSIIHLTLGYCKLEEKKVVVRLRKETKKIKISKDSHIQIVILFAEKTLFPTNKRNVELMKWIINKQNK